jgi:transcriptional regulator of arginine metabolism
MKAYRQSAILDLVLQQDVHSQDAVRRHLAARGITATQATISRDIKELGLVKRASDGAYQAGQPVAQSQTVTGDRVRRVVAECLRRAEQVQQLLVLKTDPGHAQSLALAVDQALWSEVVGTIAGDDTVLVVTRNERHATSLKRRVEHWVKA